jgi:hypothetical protein
MNHKVSFGSFIEALGHDKIFACIEMTCKRYFGGSETLLCTDTYQLDDYSKYETSAFNEAKKAQRKLEVFPEDCRKDFAMGVGFAEN